MKVLKKLTGDRPIPNLHNVILNYTHQLDYAIHELKMTHPSSILKFLRVMKSVGFFPMILSSFSLPKLSCNNSDAACKIHGFYIKFTVLYTLF